MKVTIPGKFPSLNEYINAERRHRFMAAKMKKEWTDLVYSYAIEQVPVTARPKKFPVGIKFIVHEQNSRRDIDNVASMVAKFGLDGLVKAGVLPDDSQKYINKIEFEFIVDKTSVVEIII